MTGFLGSRSATILSAVLLAQAGMFYGLRRNETIPPRKPLADFHLADGSWKNIREMQLDQEELDVLRADDILSRLYEDPNSGRVALLFVAFFETQRTGKTPHSPKNCLPGAGWVPSQSGIVDVNVPEQAEPIRVNQYVVSRGDNQSVVLYWYQARDRTIASEYAAKFFTIADSIRYNRSDTALVRVVVPVTGGNTKAAIDTAADFVRTFYQPLKHYLPA